MTRITAGFQINNFEKPIILHKNYADDHPLLPHTHQITEEAGNDNHPAPSAVRRRVRIRRCCSRFFGARPRRRLLAQGHQSVGRGRGRLFLPLLLSTAAAHSLLQYTVVYI